MANLLAPLSERGSFHPSQGLWEPQVPRTKTEMDSAATKRKLVAVIWVDLMNFSFPCSFGFW